MADIKLAYGAETTLTQTNLDAVSGSTTWVHGWESDAIDNSSNLFTDFIINCVIKTGDTSSAGEIRLYLVPEVSGGGGTSWPDTMDGTESVEDWTDTEIRDAAARLAAVAVTDATAGTADFYYLNVPSVAQVFGGIVPRRFVIFITQSTAALLSASGDPNKLWVRGTYHTV